MMWRDVVYLGNATETVTQGEVVYTYSWRQVFANKRSVRQSEYYQAADVGMKPELVFEIRTVDFGADERLKYNGKEYVITRTELHEDSIYLTVVAHVGEANG